MSIKSDKGSGAVLGLGLIFGILGIMSLGLMISNQEVEVSRLQVISDNAALAAEDVLRGLATGYPCETAEQFVESFGATLEACHIVELDLYISVSKQEMGIVHRVSSHAGVGPVPAR
jgi:secretion/DNA translocation related TadE-like protein